MKLRLVPIALLTTGLAQQATPTLQLPDLSSLLQGGIPNLLGDASIQNLLSTGALGNFDDLVKAGQQLLGDPQSLLKGFQAFANLGSAASNTQTAISSASNLLGELAQLSPMANMSASLLSAADPSALLNMAQGLVSNPMQGVLSGQSQGNQGGQALGTAAGQSGLSSSSAGSTGGNPLGSLMNLASNPGALMNLAGLGQLAQSNGLAGLGGMDLSKLGNLGGMMDLGNLGNLSGLDLSQLGGLGNLADLSQLGNLGGQLGQLGGLDLSRLGGMDLSQLGNLGGMDLSQLGNLGGLDLSQLGNLGGVDLGQLGNIGNLLPGFDHGLTGDGAFPIANITDGILGGLGGLGGLGTGGSGTGGTGSGMNPNLAATLSKAFITNGYLNIAGQNAFKLSGAANQQAYSYPDLAACLRGQSPCIDNQGRLTAAVQASLKNLGISATTAEELITAMLNQNFSASKRRLETVGEFEDYDKMVYDEMLEEEADGADRDDPVYQGYV